ncbi:MAG: hypothetical protein O2807_02830, partial [bacterium]|nr:hypothetical protein [bacterium]
PLAGSALAITGQVIVAPGLADKAKGKPVLYLIARDFQSGRTMAVVRIANPRFPLSFRISQENVMMPGVPFAGNMRLIARLDSDGSAGPVQPGDMENTAPVGAAVGEKDVKITIDKMY